MIGIRSDQNILFLKKNFLENFQKWMEITRTNQQRDLLEVLLPQKICTMRLILDTEEDILASFLEDSGSDYEDNLRARF